MINSAKGVIGSLFIQAIVAVVALELFSWFVSKQNLLLFNSRPAAYGGKLSEPLRTEMHPWGSWRNPNTTSRHKRSCFDVEIRTNELGARDDSFINSPKNSLILLGDSFAEGFGVSHYKSAATILEKKIHRPIHNLGTAGNFGPLQQYLIYKHYSPLIHHSELLVFVLPANDFTDNDINWWSDSRAQRVRYRPYYGAQDSVRPVYHQEAIKSDRLDHGKQTRSSIQKIKKSLVDYTWSANTLRTLKYLLNPKEPFTEEAPLISFYEKASIEQQKNLATAYRAIAEIATPRPVSFVIIPDKRDIEYYSVKRTDRPYKEQFWFTELKAISADSGGGLLDLLDYVPADHSSLYHSCDSHWSPRGNLWAAEAIYNLLLSETGGYTH